jgi:RNA polymerase sigma factor (sigma-70 family)
MINILDKLAEKHSDWIRIVQSFGCDLMTSEDLVQDMYLKVYDWSEKNNRSILYNKNEVNYYFIYKALRSIWLNHVNYSNRYTDKELVENLNLSTEGQESTEATLQVIEEKLSQLYWYDRKIFELVYKDGISMLQISYKTGIDYCSIKRTIKKVKKILK